MIKDKARKALFGLTIPQEYVCLSREEIEQPFSVFMTGKDGSFFSDVTASHIFLGYRPVVIAIPAPKGSENERWILKQDEICLTFTINELRIDSSWRDFSSNSSCQAKMILKKINKTHFGDIAIFFFSGVCGEHLFLSPFHQFMNTVKKKFHQPKKDNINLEGNLVDQVRIAYAVPRTISIVTVRSTDGSMNMFPTDLHGPVDKGFYLSSLRIGGKASDQVSRFKKIVLSDIQSYWYKQAYALGKNHMHDMTHPDHFEIRDQASEKFSIPVPLPALNYRELMVVDSFDAGVHRIYSYEVHSLNKITDGSRLTHIHQYAAQWRTDHSLHTDILFR